MECQKCLKEKIKQINKARDILASLHYEDIDVCFDVELGLIDETLDDLEERLKD